MAARPSDERVGARIADLRHDGVKPRHHLIGRVPGDVLAERRAVHLASGAAGAAGQAVHLGEQVIGHRHGRLHTVSITEDRAVAAAGIVVKQASLVPGSRHTIVRALMGRSTTRIVDG